MFQIIKNNIQTEIDQHRMDATLQEERLKELLLNAHTELKELFKQKDTMALAAQQAILEDLSKADRIRKGLKENLEKLDQKIEDYLIAHDIKDRFEENFYHCQICKDTGYIKNDRCICFKQEYAKRILMQNKSTLMYPVYLKDYSLSVFTDQEQSKQMHKIKNYVVDYLQSFHPKTSHNIIFFGDVGLGKTYLLSVLATELIEQGNLCVYQTASQLSDGFFSFDHNQQQEIKQLLNQSDVLILDDLGQENSTQFFISELFNIVNSRYLSHLPIIISTNLSIKEFAKRYGRAIFSRFSENSDFIPLFGEDLRKK